VDAHARDVRKALEKLAEEVLTITAKGYFADLPTEQIPTNQEKTSPIFKSAEISSKVAS